MSSQNHRTLRILSTAVWIQRKSAEVLTPLQFFWKTKIPHTHLITRGKTAWKVNLMIYLEDTCVAIAYWTILPHLSPDKDQSSVIFSSEKINEIDKYQQRTTINIEAYLIFDIRSMDLIWYLSNLDPIDLYRVTKSGILTVQKAVQAKMIMMYWVSQKTIPNFGTQFWSSEHLSEKNVIFSWF